MSITNVLTFLDEDLLEKIQEGIPLQARPFLPLAQSLGMSEAEVLAILKRLKREKVIRRISPIYVTKMLNYASSLVAFQLEPEQLEEAAEWINQHPGVSHNYQRNHSFNLWFTLAVPPDSALGLDATVELLARKLQPQKYAILPATKVFKIGVKLKFKKSKQKQVTAKTTEPSVYQELSELEKKIIACSQADLELCAEPFAEMIQALQISEAEFFQALNAFKERGIMRRFAALLYHRKAGFSANGMSVWQVPSARVDEVGQILASFDSVSHCYERSTNADWPYNVFAMIHAASEAEVASIIAEMEEQSRLNHSALLYSTREFKKKRLTYFTDDYYQWEQTYGG